MCQTVSFLVNFHGLEWSRGLVGMYLEVCFPEIQQRHVGTLLPPFTQFSCAEICIGCECVIIVVKLLEVLLWTWFNLTSRELALWEAPVFPLGTVSQLLLIHMHSLLSDLSHYQLLWYSIVQSFGHVSLWSLPYCSPAQLWWSKVAVKSDS